MSGGEAAMKKENVEKFHKQLEQLQDRLRDVGTAVVEQARGLAGGDATGQLSHAPLHLGDLGSEEYMQDMNALLAENEGYLAGEVRDALARIDAGTFGECEECRKGIAVERLEAIPFARHCVRCAEKLHKLPGDHGAPNFNRGRPGKPDDMLAPSGFMDDDLPREWRGDVHAVGDAGGGTAFGGLAGSNSANGEPNIADIQEAMGSANGDIADSRLRGHAVAVEPMDYESEEDRKRYAEEPRDGD